MPSPIGHSLAGLTVAELFQRKDRLPAVFWANAPDVDMLVGLKKKNPVAWHGHQTHSLGAALAAGLTASVLARLTGGKLGASFLEGTTAYASHLLLDYLGKQAGDGMPLLWPLSNRRWASEQAWFSTITSRSRERGFLLGLLSEHNLKAVAWEVGSLLPIYLLARSISLPRGQCARSGDCPDCA